MNPIKKDLTERLQSIKLSEEKKRDMIKRVHEGKRQQKGQWTYRLVLTMASMIGLSLAYLFVMEDGRLSPIRQQTAASPLQEASLLSTDLSKSIAILLIFLMVLLVSEVIIRKTNRRLPICLDCGEEWTFRQSLKRSSKRDQIICPACGDIQVRTEKSLLWLDLLNFMIPAGVLVALTFANPFIGYIVYAACTLLLMQRIGPYLIMLHNGQRNDKLKKFRRGLLFMMTIALIFLFIKELNYRDEQAYRYPNEAVMAFLEDDSAVLIPKEVLGKEAMYFVLNDQNQILQAFAKKDFWGWKAYLSVSSPFEYRHETERYSVNRFSYGEFNYGILKVPDVELDLIVSLGDEIARLWPLQMAEELRNKGLDDVYIWFVDSDENLEDEKVNIIDQERNVVLEELDF